MDRYAPGVYQIQLPTGIASSTINLDNKRVILQGTQVYTVYVKDILSFDSGKLFPTYINDNIKNISGAVVGE